MNLCITISGNSNNGSNSNRGLIFFSVYILYHFSTTRHPHQHSNRPTRCRPHSYHRVILVINEISNLSLYNHSQLIIWLHHMLTPRGINPPQELTYQHPYNRPRDLQCPGSRRMCIVVPQHCKNLWCEEPVAHSLNTHLRPISLLGHTHPHPQLERHSNAPDVTLYSMFYKVIGTTLRFVLKDNCSRKILLFFIGFFYLKDFFYCK